MSQGHRRLAAIMFTDLVGYTALGQRNESLSLALVDEQRKIIRPVLKRHNGIEIKTIGDAFLVEFPSSIDGVRCAYDIQREVKEFNITLPEDRRIHLRIGIHVGDVVENSNEGGLDISGDAVNIASRIESLAEDGGVCLSQQVYDQVHNKFELALVSLGQRQLKNIESKIEIYKILMPWSESSKQKEEVILDRRRIAVLPFKNMSSDPSDEYFAEGLTEELILTLSTIGGLRVISRTSVMAYKNNPKRLDEIGRELSAGAIVEGSVRKAGARLRITVQLIDANTDEHLWSDKFDRQLDDVFAIQSEISESVAEALRVNLAQGEKERMSREKTRDMSAYQDYLLGRHYLLVAHTEEDIKKAIEQLKKVTSADPKFAKAYDGLANAYEQLGHWSFINFSESYKLSRAMVEKALELDPELSEGHATLGFLILIFDWNLEEADKEFRKSIELDPSNASAHYRYSRCLAAQGRLEEATTQAEIARELDPLNPRPYSEVANMYYLSGRDGDAFKLWAKARQLFPDSFSPSFFSILARLARGEYDEAQDEFSHLSKQYLEEPLGIYLKGMVAGCLGEKAKALECAGKLQALVENGRSSGDLVAGIFASMGDADGFFRWAKEAVRLHHFELYVLKNHSKCYPKIDNDSRWSELLSQAGLA